MPPVNLTCPRCKGLCSWSCNGLHGYGTCRTCGASGNVRRFGLSDTPHWAPGSLTPPKATP